MSKFFYVSLLFLALVLISHVVADEWVSTIKQPDYNAMRLYNEGIEYCNQSKYLDALYSFDKASTLEPNFVDAWVMKGVALDELGRYHEALDATDKALSINKIYAFTLKSPAFALNNKGLQLIHLGRFEEAYYTIKEAVGKDPYNASQWINYGLILSIRGEHQSALEACNRSVELDPNDAGAWFNKGLRLRELNRIQEELDAYNKALSLNPKYSSVWTNKGIALDKLSKSQEALDAFDTALSITPDDAYTLNLKGILLNKLGRHQEALDVYNRALELVPNDTESLTLSMQYEGVIPDPFDIWSKKGYSLYYLGRYVEAVEAANKALTLNSNNKVAIEVRDMAQSKISTTSGSSPLTTTTTQITVSASQPNTNTPAATPATTKAVSSPLLPILSGVVGSFLVLSRKCQADKAI